MCDDCGEIMHPIDRMYAVGPPPHRCEACKAATEWEDDDEH